MGYTYFITGVNRGIGLAFITELVQDPNNTIIATVRDVSSAESALELSQNHSNLKLVTLDVASAESISKLDTQLQVLAKDGIDVFISNAGYGSAYTPVLQATVHEMTKHHLINTIGPIEVFKVLYPYLKARKTKKAYFLSSIAGSIGTNIPSCSTYGQSKSALNRLLVGLALELKEEGFIVNALHPGLVATDMFLNGLKNGFSEELKRQLLDQSISARTSVTQMLQVFNENEETGVFISNTGEEIPW